MPKKASLYIHIPFCTSRCAYCDFFSTVQKDVSIYKKYVETLANDVVFFKNKYAIDYFETVYIGGGSPSLLDENLISRLSQFIMSLQKEKIDEFTIEATPKDISKQKLKAWQEAGINRLSLGIESMEDSVLQIVNRISNRASILEALECISNLWEGELSFDFIAGLEGETIKSFLNNLEIALKYRPNHISLYELIPHNQKEGAEQKLLKEKMWQKGAELLISFGYIQYEVSNFSYKGGFESLHNKAYWQFYDYIGVGSSSTGNVKISCLPTVYDRFTGICDITQYMEEKNRDSAYTLEEVKGLDVIKDALLMGFRLVKGIDIKYFDATFGASLLDLIPNTIKTWKEHSLLVLENGFCRLKDAGLLLLNQFLLSCFTELEKR